MLSRERLNDPGLLLQAHHCQWATLFNLGDHTACCAHIEAGLALYDRERHGSHASLYGGHDPKVCGLGERALALWLLGYPEQALRSAEAGLAYAHDLAQAGSLAHSMDQTVMLHRYRRDARAVLREASRMMDFSVEQALRDHKVKGEFFCGWARALLGEPLEGVRAMEAAVEAQRAIGTTEDFPVYYDMLAEVLALVDRIDEACSAIERAFKEAQSSGLAYWNAELHRRRAELLWRRAGHPVEEARADLAAAFELARAQDARSLELRAAMTAFRMAVGDTETRDGAGRSAPGLRAFSRRFRHRRSRRGGTSARDGHAVNALAGLAANQPKRYRRGTDRIVPPEATLARVRPLLPAMGITRIANVTGLDRIGIPVVMVSRPNSRSLSLSQGKGLDLAAAKASGVMEAIETYHAETITLPLKFASFGELCYSHSHGRHRRAAVLRRQSLAGRSHDALDRGTGSAFRGRPVWLPHELVSTNYTLPLPPGSGCFTASSNGFASGNSLAEAICHGICELIERDATTLWRLRSDASRAARAIDPETIDDADCRGLLDRFERADVAVRIWDATSDIEVACFQCLIMGRHGQDADPEFGAGCHPRREVALCRALTEAAQARTTYIVGARDDLASELYEEAARARRAEDGPGVLRGAATRGRLRAPCRAGMRRRSRTTSRKSCAACSGWACIRRRSSS